MKGSGDNSTEARDSTDAPSPNVASYIPTGINQTILNDTMISEEPSFYD
jgi:hypothetical protein